MSTLNGLAAEEFPTLRTLESFPDVLRGGYVTVCEINGELQVTLSGDPENAVDSVGFTNLTEHYVPIYGDNLKPIQTQKIPSIKTVTIDEPFLADPSEHGLKAVWNAWQDAGFNGALQTLQSSGTPEYVVASLQKIVDVAKLVASAKRRVEVAIYPHLGLSTEGLIEHFAPVRNWSKSWIRAMSWHPQFPTLAVALRDDSIRVFVNEQCSYVSPFLKAPEQALVSALCWRPYSDELAVGVESGIVLWNSPSSAKPGHVKSTFVSVKDHCPVTSVEYSFTGNFLLSSSPAHASVIIWEVDTLDYVALHRFSGGGFPRAVWSPNSTSHIFCTSPTAMFRVWSLDEESNYRPKTWATSESPVDAIAWHPKSLFAVFASDSVLYALNFKPPSVQFSESDITPVMTPLYDIKECLIAQEQSDLFYKVGGKVVQMEWDPTGRRLVVMFDDSEVLALFHVLPIADIRLAPFGFIKGHLGEYPVAIAFQKDFAAGALLSIAWSSGRSQYFPFLFHGGGHTFANQIKSYRFNSEKLNATEISPKCASAKLFTTANSPVSSVTTNESFKLFSHDDQD